jgi:Holliday junction resolvase RusA-like endonuclease
MIQNRKKRQSKKVTNAVTMNNTDKSNKSSVTRDHVKKILTVEHFDTLDTVTDLTTFDLTQLDANPLYRISEEITEFILPYKAFTLNSYYRSNRNIVHISKDGANWKKLIDAYITVNRLPKLLGKIKLDVGFFFRTRQKRDIDNLFKPLIDVFKDKLFEDDDMIYQINSYKKIGMGADMIHVKLTLIDV